MRKAILVFAVLTLVPCISNAEIIDVNIKGVDDGVRTTKQQDYKEAVLFAKREAIERAGVKIMALTTARDFVVNSDYIESKAEAVLMPGYQIMDIGYQSDKTYLVILIGKVKTLEDKLETKELRYAKLLIDKGERRKALDTLNNLIDNSKNDKAIEEAMYYKVAWGFAGTQQTNEIFDKLSAYYPNSRFIDKIETMRKVKKHNNKDKVKIEVKVNKNMHHNNTQVHESEYEFIDKNNQTYRLRVLGFAQGYINKYDKFDIDVKVDVTYKFFMNNDFVGSITGALDCRLLPSWGSFKIDRGSMSTRWKGSAETFQAYPVEIKFEPVDRTPYAICLSFNTINKALF